MHVIWHAGGAAALWLALVADVLAGNWPEVPPPPRASVGWVSSEVRVNGLNARIQHFESELGVDEVLKFYRSRWTRPSLAPREVAAGGWRSIATLQDRHQLLVQVRARSPQGSEGMLSVADISDVKVDHLPKDWPSFRNVQVVQVTESLDGARRSHLISMVSTDGFDINVSRMREEWGKRGYQLDLQRVNPPSAGDVSWIGLFNKQDSSLDVMVAYSNTDRRTYITTNLVTPASAGAQP